MIDAAMATPMPYCTFSPITAAAVTTATANSPRRTTRRRCSPRTSTSWAPIRKTTAASAASGR